MAAGFGGEKDNGVYEAVGRR